MAKAPVTGAVKTRLVPPLSHEQAARLATCFLRDTASNVADVAMGTGTRGVILFTPADANRLFERLVPDTFSLLAQRGAALGERLLNATSDLLTENYESVCLINSDSPNLPPSLLAAAVDALALPGDRVVLGGADDGGYYLIGLKQAHKRIFTDIAWSTPRVLEHTIARVRELSVDLVMLPKWYDIDDLAALDRLRNDLFVSPAAENNGHRPYDASHTREYLAQLFEIDDANPTS